MLQTDTIRIRIRIHNTASYILYSLCLGSHGQQFPRPEDAAGAAAEAGRHLQRCHPRGQGQTKPEEVHLRRPDLPHQQLHTGQQRSKQRGELKNHL